MAGAGTDYYSMQYPSCYSPATQGYTGASGYPSMMGGAAASTPTAQPPHTHSEYAPASSSSTSLSGPTSSRRSPGPGGGGGGGPTGGGVTPAPLTTANVRKVVLIEPSIVQGIFVVEEAQIQINLTYLLFSDNN